MRKTGMRCAVHTKENPSQIGKISFNFVHEPRWNALKTEEMQKNESQKKKE